MLVIRKQIEKKDHTIAQEMSMAALLGIKKNTMFSCRCCCCFSLSHVLSLSSNVIASVHPLSNSVIHHGHHLLFCGGGVWIGCGCGHLCGSSVLKSII